MGEIKELGRQGKPLNLGKTTVAIKAMLFNAEVAESAEGKTGEGRYFPGLTSPGVQRKRQRYFAPGQGVRGWDRCATGTTRGQGQDSYEYA